jgi:hypothetical protein
MADQVLYPIYVGAMSLKVVMENLNMSFVAPRLHLHDTLCESGCVGKLHMHVAKAFDDEERVGRAMFHLP